MAELLGAFFLVFTALSTGTVSPVLTAATVSAVLVVCMWVGAHISGGYFNPAVTLGVYLRGGMSVLDLWSYWAAQLTGALLAAVLALTVLPSDLASLPDASTLAPVAVLEFLFTFALVYVVLSVGSSPRQENNVFLGVVSGIVVLAGMLSVSALATAAFNPAIAFGLSVDGAVGWSTVAAYVGAELAAGVAAAAFLARTQPARSPASHSYRGSQR